MKKTTAHSFSGNVLNISLPKSWSELTQEQLLYVALVLTRFGATEVKTYAFIRFAGITVHRKNRRGWLCSILLQGIIRRKRIRFMLAQWQIESFIHQLDWLETPPQCPVRPLCISHYAAIDAELHGLPFRDYLICENLYQGYLFTKDMEQLRKMVPFLYIDMRYMIGALLPTHKWREHELTCIFIWWMSVKQYFAGLFPDFFQPAPTASDFNPGPRNMADQMNVQIRALTGGDVTKEQTVLDMDCWRALTELNAKAHDIRLQKERQRASAG